jgi:hypothetical protein
MKLIKKTLVAAACVGTLVFAGSAFAGGTQTLTPTGNVPATCVFTSGPYSMPFGTLTPGGGAASHTTTIAYQCTNGTAASSIKVNSAASPTTVNMVNTLDATTLPVGLAWTVPATLGVGIGSTLASISMDINGSITAAAINTATAGSYTGVYNIDLLP